MFVMFTEDKVTELFCMADDFGKFFDRMVAKIRSRVQQRVLITVIPPYQKQKSCS